jgi:hypothetical protein
MSEYSLCRCHAEAIAFSNVRYLAVRAAADGYYRKQGPTSWPANQCWDTVEMSAG